MRKQAIYWMWALVFLPAAISAQTNLINAFAESYELEEAGQFQAAIEAVEVYYASDSYEINLRLGWLHYLRGDYTQSRSYYKRCIFLEPKAIEPMLGVALPAGAMGNWTEVEKTYKSVLKIDPNNTFAHYRLASLYYEWQQYDAAHTHLEKVLTLYPFDYESVVLFAWVNYQIGHRSESRYFFYKALLIEPESEWAAEGMKLVEEGL